MGFLSKTCLPKRWKKAKQKSEEQKKEESPPPPPPKPEEPKRSDDSPPPPRPSPIRHSRGRGGEEKSGWQEWDDMIIRPGIRDFEITYGKTYRWSFDHDMDYYQHHQYYRPPPMPRARGRYLGPHAPRMLPPPPPAGYYNHGSPPRLHPPPMPRPRGRYLEPPMRLLPPPPSPGYYNHGSPPPSRARNPFPLGGPFYDQSYRQPFL